MKCGSIREKGSGNSRGEEFFSADENRAEGGRINSVDRTALCACKRALSQCWDAVNQVIFNTQPFFCCFYSSAKSILCDVSLIRRMVYGFAP